jgi:outer membrane protein TolC
VTPDERAIIEQVRHNLSGLNGGLTSTNMSRADLRLFQATITRIQTVLDILLEVDEEAPHADD